VLLVVGQKWLCLPAPLNKLKQYHENGDDQHGMHDAAQCVAGCHPSPHRIKRITKMVQIMFASFLKAEGRKKLFKE